MRMISPIFLCAVFSRAATLEIAEGGRGQLAAARYLHLLRALHAAIANSRPPPPSFVLSCTASP